MGIVEECNMNSLGEYHLEDSDNCCCQQIYESCDTLGRRKCAVNVMMRIMDALEIHKWDRFLSSKFLKIRHNFFADCFMGDNLLEIRSTDYCLRNIGIDSDLSPDIYLGEHEGVHKFLEFFVSSNPEIALENKKQKYGGFESDGLISVSYVYFDMKMMMCFSEPESDFKSEYNIGFFTNLMKMTAKIDRYITYDSSELEIENITPGKKYECHPQRIYYSPVYQEYSFEELSKSVKYLVDKISCFPDDMRCGVYFDCKTRRFSIRSGNRDPMWLLRAVRDNNILRDIVIYENYENESGLLDKSMLDLDYRYEGDSGGHVLKINESQQFHDCLEPALTAEEIHSNLKEMEFEGLYSKVLTPEIISSQAKNFYEKWSRDCESVVNPKIKSTTMIMLPDPDRIDDGFNKSSILKFSRGWIRLALSKITESATGLDKQNLGELDREIREQYAFCEHSENKMKSIRKRMMELDGANKMSYRVMILTNLAKSAVRSLGNNWTPNSVVTNPEFCSSANMSILEREYVYTYLERMKSMRTTRRMMKSKIRRENMFTMDKEMYSLYKHETENFLRKRMKGEERMGFYGYRDISNFDEVESMFKDFWYYLCQDSSFFNDWFDIRFTENAFPDSVAGKQCRDYYSFYRTCKEKIRKTRIYRIILWMSNLARSIWAISTYKTKKRKVVFDRFGTKNCLLFVCSTGNIQKFKSSKAFKILIPICSEVKKFCGHDRIPGVNIIRDSSGFEYAETHWAYLKIQHLKYFMELPGRWLQTVCCVMSEYGISNIDSDVYMYLTYCMLNARRKNENLLHDLKYMTYNMFGIRGCYSDLLEDKFEIPRDILQRYIEEKFLKEIPRFMKSLDQNQLLTVNPVGSYPSYRLMHPLAQKEYGLDSFNIFVYSSYCFPKGVFTHSVEQTINMSSILSIHSSAMSSLGVADDYYSVKEATDKKFDEIFDCDLNYNSGVVSAVGLFCEHYISTKGENFDIRGSWSRIINSDITEYANSHGLRENDLSKSDSWGKKGHDVMTAFLSKNCSTDCLGKFESSSPKTIKDVSKLKWEICKTKYRIIDYAKSHPIENVELNNANKVQWGGSREIYIMTMGAKNIQWSLEQMFARIAKSLDNEFIHVPASDRFGQLYNNIKSPVSGVRYYLTLDCRKWAPLSNLNKYLVFINSMSGILPQEFVEDFNYFFDIYYRKRLFFKSGDVESFLSRKQNECYKDFFIKCGCAYYIKMPYSFMMGMFNYLSSVLHAISQKYFEQNIIPLIEKDTKSKIKFSMFAHSDDSGGYVEISNSPDPESVLTCILREYEGFQKCLNHMFSLKKCTVGTSYFEITSYCFMKTDPMPVLPKFIFNHQINLTPSGYLSDVKSISSNVMEMIANGSSFRTAYIKYIILGNSYRKFCIGECLNDTDSRVSLDLGGFPGIHPFYLCVYKSLGENKWLSEFDDSTYGLNAEILANLGMSDPWGKRRGLKVRMVSMKQRSNDGRFAKFETMKEIPDEIIPSGHFFCYMRKMSSKYYSDVMWFSMHDIDGTVIQSNLFNNGLCQTYHFMGREYGISDLIARVKSLIFSKEISGERPVFPDYINDIDSNLKINDGVIYKASEVRAKPAEINTYYNKWWRNKSREIKIIALSKLCPWMGIMCSSPLEYYNCLESSDSIDMSDVIKNLCEEEPLMRFMMTTKSESRIMDRFDTLSSWMFYNSYPGMHPKSVKRIEYKYNLPTKNFHVECISAILFESVCSGRAQNPSDIQLVEDSEDGVRVITPVNTWLEKRNSEDPIFMIVRGNLPRMWLEKIDFISVKSLQYSQMGRYWVGRTSCVCRISGRSYELSVKNGRIIKISCKSTYSIKTIRGDMQIIDKFGFSFSASPSSYKTQKILRITQSPSGDWVWADDMRGMPYYSSIVLDESINTKDSLLYEENMGEMNSLKIKTKWSNFKLKYKEGKNKYKAYILHKKPCDRCLSHCKYAGHDFCVGEKTEYDIKIGINELIDRWKETQTYKNLYKELIKYESLFCSHCTFMGQIGTYLSSAYIGPKMIDEQNFFTNHKGELCLSSMSEQIIPTEVVENVKSNLSNFVKFRYKHGAIEVSSDHARVKELVAQYGSPAVSTALVLLPMERTMDYYSLMTYDDYWYNNSQILPNFLMDTISYLNDTLYKQEGMMSEKQRILFKLVQEIPDYLSLTYSKMIKNSYYSSIPIDLRLNAYIRRFKDVGEPSDNSISQRYYYDPDSIIGCIAGWMRYILIYSHRKNGILDPDHKVGYKREYLGFLKKYKSFCIEKIQYTIKIRSLNEFRIFEMMPFQLEEEYDEAKYYPLPDCDFYDFTQEDEYFDEEIMTTDREESMISFGYNEREEYDFSNESIFHKEGFIKKMRMCSADEANNWVPINLDSDLFKLRRFKGKNVVGVNGTRFTSSNIHATSNIDLPKEIPFKEENGGGTVLEAMIEQLSEKEKEILAEENPIVKTSSGYKARMNLINSMFARHSLFKHIFDETGDVTHILEESYDAITNLSKPLSDTMFNQLSNAEMNTLSPGIVADMETNCYRMTQNQINQITTIRKATKFKNKAIEYSIIRFIASCMIVRTQDVMCEQTSERLFYLIKLAGETTDLSKDEKLPDPYEGEYTIPYTMRIGV